MEPDATTLASDLDAIIGGMPHTMVWNGQNITVSMDDIVRDDSVQMVGVFQNRTVGVYAKVASFTSSIIPSVGDTCVIETVTYRITRSSKGPDGIGWQGGLVRKSG